MVKIPLVAAISWDDVGTTLSIFTGLYLYVFLRDRGFIKAVQRGGLAAGIICLVTLRPLVSYGWYVSITIVFSIAAL